MQGAWVCSLVAELDPTFCNENRRFRVLQLRPGAAKYVNKILKKKKKLQNSPMAAGQAGQDGPDRSHRETQASAGQDQRI